MKTQMIIAGLVRLSGTSRKTGNQYDFWTATVLQPRRISGSVASAHGFEATEMSCEPVVAAALKDGKFPITVEATLGLDRDNKAFIESVAANAAKAA